MELDARRQALEALLSVHRPPTRGRFCDFGAGDALTAVAARDMFDDVHAVESALVNARAALSLTAAPGQAPIALHRNLSRAPAECDLIVSIDYLQHCRNLRPVMTELDAHLARDGLLIVVVPVYSPENLTAATAYLPGAAGLAPTLAGFGWTVVEALIDAEARRERIVLRAGPKGA